MTADDEVIRPARRNDCSDIARPVPVQVADRERVDRAIANLKASRAGKTLGGLDWKALREEGRR